MVILPTTLDVTLIPVPPLKTTLGRFVGSKQRVYVTTPVIGSVSEVTSKYSLVSQTSTIEPLDAAATYAQKKLIISSSASAIFVSVATTTSSKHSISTPV